MSDLTSTLIDIARAGSDDRQTLRDGDIYSWRWADDGRHADSAPYRSYHCRSRIAEVVKGILYDTFWTHPNYENALKPEDVVLTLLGNVNEMTVIRPGERHYYRSEDVVDTRHSNDGRAPVYLKAGATRNAEVMRDHVSDLRREAESDLRMAQHRLERADALDALINRGELDAVYF